MTMDSILQESYYKGPRIYIHEELIGIHALFRERTALFFTPTANIPLEWVGEGRLDAFLPLASPTLYEWDTNPAFRVPRLWVDLLQRATGRLRWTPVSPAKVTIVRYDTDALDPIEAAAGAKAVLDALVDRRTGRKDGRSLYYFGAIVDDNSLDLTHHDFHQVLVEEHIEARTRIVVEPAPPEEVERAVYRYFAPGAGTLPS